MASSNVIVEIHGFGQWDSFAPSNRGQFGKDEIGIMGVMVFSCFRPYNVNHPSKLYNTSRNHLTKDHAQDQSEEQCLFL